MGADEALSGRRRRTVEATVLEEMPRGLYRVVLDNQQSVLAHPAGGKERNFVRLLPGDRVEVELAPRDYSRGRILRKAVRLQAHRKGETV